MLPQWWYEFSYDPLLASLVSGLMVAVAMTIPTYIWTHRGKANRPHCERCCPEVPVEKRRPNRATITGTGPREAPPPRGLELVE